MKRLFLAAAAALSLAACATPTPYQPLQQNASVSGGYADTKISRDRYRVSFQGNTVTDRDTVERYLLFRAAELTKSEGFDWFAIADRGTERQSRDYLVSNDPFGYGAWQPVWYRLRNGQLVVINTYDPFYRESYYRERVDQYRASAEIFLGKGAKPANDPKAFDAGEVIANLSPTIKRPDAA